MGNRGVLSAVHVVLINLAFRKLKLRQPEPYATAGGPDAPLLSFLPSPPKNFSEDMAGIKSLREFALSALSTIRKELLDEVQENRPDTASCRNKCTQRLLALVQESSAAQVPVGYKQELSRIAGTAYEKMKNEGRLASAWRRIYSDAFLVCSMMDCLSDQLLSTKAWGETIARLDMTIVVAGAPGEGRLDLILDAIRKIQEAHLPIVSSLPDRQSDHISPPNTLLEVPVATAAQVIPCLRTIPSFSAFQSRFHSKPFILRNFASVWPAISDHKWASKAYLKHVAGEGRIVPIEIGNDYRTDDWSQEMMSWYTFLDYLFPDDKNDIGEKRDILYLAQHDLFRQFPALYGDVTIPDYVYSDLPPPECFPHYRQPANEDGLVMNVWLGPEKTISPAHTDPYFNFYVQVAGYKTIWLASPHISSDMSPFSEPAQSSAVEESSTRHPAVNQVNPTLSNTSRIDVFAEIASESETDGDMGEDQLLKAFRTSVIPEAMSATLGPGDLLFFPPGWWHAMRSETVSFSVSMWF